MGLVDLFVSNFMFRVDAFGDSVFVSISLFALNLTIWEVSLLLFIALWSMVKETGPSNLLCLLVKVDLLVWEILGNLREVKIKLVHLLRRKIRKYGFSDILVNFVIWVFDKGFNLVKRVESEV